MHKTRTTLQHDGPNHPGLWSIRSGRCCCCAAGLPRRPAMSLSAARCTCSWSGAAAAAGASTRRRPAGTERPPALRAARLPPPTDLPQRASAPCVMCRVVNQCVCVCACAIGQRVYHHCVFFAVLPPPSGGASRVETSSTSAVTRQKAPATAGGAAEPSRAKSSPESVGPTTPAPPARVLSFCFTPRSPFSRCFDTGGEGVSVK